MARLLFALCAAGVCAGAFVSAQLPDAFKLGTFSHQNRTFVGIVVRDALVVDFAAAHAALPGGRSGAAVRPPADMKDLIGRYESGLRDRIGEVVKAVNAAAQRPAYVYDLATVETLPPILYPTTMLNAAVNYREHGVEMLKAGASPQVQAAAGSPPPGTAPPGTKTMSGIWERRADDTRWNPYLFMKAPTAVIAHGEAIRVPRGRNQVDWECELGAVISRRASRVPVGQAGGYIFGYTMEMDVSDREARGDGRYGSDWLIAKNHDTFAPLGPFITPKEFVRDPRKLPVKFTLNGQVMQDADTSYMIHDVFELVAYASSIMTLNSGDVIATGSPAGVGSARTPPIFLKPGDRTSCTYEGIGTLSNTVEAATP